MVQLLLGAHAVYHVDYIHSCNVYLLLLGGEGSLSGLQPLLLVLLFLGGCLWVFSDRALVGIPEKD